MGEKLYPTTKYTWACGLQLGKYLQMNFMLWLLKSKFYCLYIMGSTG